jgi:peptidoglycan/LPS O-acetylase OafA/YrhL
MKKPSRNETIDILRGLAVFAMILIHTNTYFSNNKIAYFLWDYSQFAVPVFVFCSAFVFFKISSVKNDVYNFEYFKKRLSRLFIPYYIFLCFYLPYLFFTKPSTLDLNYFLKSIFVLGGVELNWLVMLFTFFTFIMPVIQHISLKNKPLLGILFMTSWCVGILLLFFKFPFHYRWIMWLPWTTIIIFSWFFAKFEEQKWMTQIVILLSGLTFFITWNIQNALNHPLTQFGNKYPPNLFHLSYGILGITVLYVLAKKGAFNFSPLKNLMLFLSRYSYEIFFVHFFILFVALDFLDEKKFGWIGFFLLIFGSTLVVQCGMNKLRNLSLNKS